MGDFEERSYREHETHYEGHTDDGEHAGDAETWLRSDTVDAWRHHRKHRSLDPLLEADSESEWVTIGDGRWGREAMYIEEHGHDAVATDISDELLQEAQERGLIDDFSKENAEDLSFDDESFDYAFCKESLHHFPRPYLAIYEMLRVTRKGIVLLHINDKPVVDSAFTKLTYESLTAVKNGLKRLLGRGETAHFESGSGNYVYMFSRRELEKLALGLSYDTIAFRGLNDHHIEGAEQEKLASDGPIQRKIRRKIRLKDTLCRLRLMDYDKLGTVILKESPGNQLIDALKGAGYRVKDLPDNPYINPE